MLHGLAERPAGGGVPQPRRLVMAPGEDRLAVGAEGDRTPPCAVGEDLLQLDVVAPPGRQVGQGDVLAGLVSRLGRHPQRLDGPEHPDADLPLLEGGLAALEIEHRQPAVRLGQCGLEAAALILQGGALLLEVARQPGDPLVRLGLLGGVAVCRSA